MSENLRFSFLKYQDFRLFLAISDHGLCWLSLSTDFTRSKPIKVPAPTEISPAFTEDSDPTTVSAPSEVSSNINVPSLTKKEPLMKDERWMRRHFPDAIWAEDEIALTPYLQQLEQYFEGKRDTFTLPLDLRGTEFQLKVWQALQEIPYGKTKSYAKIAQEMNRPKAVRAVAAAIGANPVPLYIPCHRVIGTNGSLTGYRYGIHVKKKLLQLEKA